MSKYHNKRIVTQDGKFDSQREYSRWCELKLMQRAGLITDLQRQVRFNLVPAQRAPGKRGRVLEHAVDYVADFVYTVDGQQVVEDSKGAKTPDYIIKRKLMLWLHGIAIKET